MELPNNASWAANRGPVTVATALGGVAALLAIVLVSVLGPNPLPGLLLIEGAWAIPLAGMMTRRLQHTYSPRTIELVPNGILGYMDRGPNHYFRLEMGFEDLKRLVPAADQTGKSNLFRFPYIEGRGQRVLDGWRPLTRDPRRLFQQPREFMKIVLTESNLRAVAEARDAWARPADPGLR